MTRTWMTLIALGALAGCAGVPYGRGAAVETGAEVQRAPVAVAGRVASSLPERYYVLSGPAETYRSYRVTERFQGLFAEYVARKTGAGSPGVEVAVSLDELTTGYREVGGVEPAREGRFAGGTGSAGVQVASAAPVASLGLLGRFGDLDRDRGDLSIPYEITKKAALSATVEVTAQGRSLAREPVKAEAVEVIPWEEYDSWAYDYTAVLDAAMRRLLVEVDRVVDGALTSLGR